jgi:ubiquinone/menaquinone biosynthesis C-methylase UbiE
MNTDLIDLIFEDVQRRHPRSLAGLVEARELSPEAFARIASTYLGWYVEARGKCALPQAIDAFASFCSDVNMAQGRYELAGHYENKSFEECLHSVYGDAEKMTDYLWGVYFSNFLWAHHLDLMLFFEQRFLSRLRSEGSLIEIAPGHGGWGLWALQQKPGLKLSGYDVSPTSMVIAGALAEAAKLGSRAHYEERNAMDLCLQPSPLAQACICCFLVEHLEDPAGLLKSMAHVLEPGGLAFFTGALTAAQVDHIYEFTTESELMLLAEQAGFRVLESRSVAPARQLSKAKFLPRSMALVMQKKTHDSW